jgi:adenylate cyclase class 2
VCNLNDWEVEVNDFGTMGLIRESLGFHKEQIYEKWRETFALNDTLLCLDTQPFGDFLKIEGDQKGKKIWRIDKI